MFFNQQKSKGHEINPDEIFLDSSNLPEFDTFQFEGRIEKPISKKAIVYLGIFFVAITIVFFWKLSLLQIMESGAFTVLSENNRLQHRILFAERGVIFDRNHEELAWNEPFVARDFLEEPKFYALDFSSRKYIRKNGFAHVLGYVRFPQKDTRGFYYQEELRGEEGIERFYDKVLRGENGLELIENNAIGEVQSGNTLRPPLGGENIVLSIDGRVQEKLSEFISGVVSDRDFEGGSGVIMDVKTGEILALTNVPEYDPQILSEGKDAGAIRALRENPNKPFLNRAVSGLYAPGSIVKPFVALGALNEDIILPSRKILSTGSISVPNPYFPNKESVFYDWKAHGLVDMTKALAVSSNVYFYEIGGGYEGQEGLGIQRIEEYMRLFGFGEKPEIDLWEAAKGIIPTPLWKRATFNDEWRLGDTYNTAIGQYGFQVTPLQVARATALIANGGRLIAPRLIQALEKNKDYIKGGTSREIVVGRDTEKKIPISEQSFDIVREGMRMAVTEGTAKGLDIKAVSVAAKTGTAEIGISKKRVNSWIIGFFPYEKPRYSFAVVMESGKRDNLIGALFAMRQLFEWMSVETPEYLRVL